MRRPNTLIVLVAGMAAGAAGSYWYAHRPEPVATPAAAEQSQPAKAERKILYYRNPMGLPDTSPVPKKDTMGMDYIPVYADEHDDPNTVKVSLDKIQRSGVRTEKVEARAISRSRARRRHRPARRVAALDRDRALRRLYRGAVRQQDRTARRQGRAAVPLLQPANSTRAGRPPGGHARAKAHRPSPRRAEASPAPCRNCAISTFRTAASMRCARP